MAKLNQWTSRQASALADDLDEEDEARPAAPAGPQRNPGRKPARGSRRAAMPDLVPNYDPAYDPEEDAEAYLRARRRISPRKAGRLRTLARTRFGRILLGSALLVLLGGLGIGCWAVRSFLQHDPRFRIDSSSAIEATGITELSRADLVGVFGSDIGRNVFFVPLARREAALEAQPWVRHATVMRLLPNTLRVTIEERAPVAFVRIGRQIELVDKDGVLLNMPPATLAARHYSFPVIVGLDPNSPPQARADRMRLFQSFVAALDSGGAKVSSQLSEVDLSDLDDVRAVVPAQGTDILLHFGNSDFLERYRSYTEHLPEWRQQYPNLSAVDLRYDRQVVLKMADAAQADEVAESKPLAGAEPQAAASPANHAGRPAPHAATAPHAAAGAHRAAAQHSTAKPHHPARTWYTERRGPHKTMHWVPHYIPDAGRAR